MEDCYVTAVLSKDDRVCGVETNHGAIDCDYFVNCAGFWARQASPCTLIIYNVGIYNDVLLPLRRCCDAVRVPCTATSARRDSILCFHFFFCVLLGTLLAHRTVHNCAEFIVLHFIDFLLM